ncbi:MAG: hypothetical protein ACTHOG_10165 [Marmoricola sp.]
MHYDNYDVAEGDKRLIGIAARHFVTRETRRQRRILANQLLDTGLFGHLTDSELAHLSAEAHEFSYPSHWTVLPVGTVPDLALILLSGSATYGVGGSAVGTAGPGSVVGLVEAIEARPTRMSLTSDVPLRGVAIDPQIVSRALRPAVSLAPAASAVLVPAPAH